MDLPNMDLRSLDQRQVALILARGRAITGLAMIVLPGLVGRVLFGRAGGAPVSKALLRLTGVRDLALGVGAITTLKEQTMDAEWVGMGAVCDGVDVATLLLTPGLTKAARAGSLIAAGGAVGGVLASRALADERNQRPLPSD
jgi:hypothetical protein